LHNYSRLKAGVPSAASKSYLNGLPRQSKV